MNNVAVIITVYQNDNFDDFQKAIKSLYCQSVEGLEIYVQEDGEVDSDIHQFLIRELKEKRIVYLGERKLNKGFDYSLNELINITLKVGYEYLVRMDADDLSSAQRVERQLQFMQDNKNIDVCGTYIEEFGDGVDYKKIVSYPLTHQEMLYFFRKRVPLAHVSAMFRRSFFEKAGQYESGGHINNGDTILWMKGFMSGCEFANIEYIGVKVRITKDFFRRRGGLKKTISDFNNRLTVIRNLEYGFSAYLYALITLLVNMLPPSLKKYAYKYLRR